VVILQEFTRSSFRCTSAVCSRSAGWQKCGTGWWWVSSGCSWCHAGCRSCPPSSPPPWWFSWRGPAARRRLPGTRCACCVSITAPASPPAGSHLKKPGRGSNGAPSWWATCSWTFHKSETFVKLYLWWGWSLWWCSPLSVAQTPRWLDEHGLPSLCASSSSWPGLGSRWLTPGAHWRVYAGKLRNRVGGVFIFIIIAVIIINNKTPMLDYTSSGK